MIKFTKVRDVKSPVRSHDTDSGIDFFIPSKIGHNYQYRIPPGFSTIIPSGIKMKVPDGFAGVFMNRSSIAGRGLIVGACVVDSNFQGEIHFNFHNISTKTITILPETRAVQMLIIPVRLDQMQECEDPFDGEETERGAGMFGSTGTG